jgi:DNA polymerase III gamma/tau subunit
VDAMRQLVELGEYMPFSGQCRLVLIDECHMLSRSAWNAALKLLEEPPSHLYLALCTTEFEKVPETVRTRCFHVVLRLVEARDMEDLLLYVSMKEGWVVEDAVIQEIIKAATGQPRKALNILQVVHGVHNLEEVERIVSLMDMQETAGELGQLLLSNKPWSEIRKSLLATEDEDYEKLKIGLARYLGAVMVKQENPDRAKAIWRMIDAIIFPVSNFDPKTGFIAAVGRILWS